MNCTRSWCSQRATARAGEALSQNERPTRSHARHVTERYVFRLTAEDRESATATAPSHATRPVHSCGLSWRRPITRKVQPHIFDSLQDAQAFHSQIQAQLNARSFTPTIPKGYQ